MANAALSRVGDEIRTLELNELLSVERAVQAQGEPLSETIIGERR